MRYPLISASRVFSIFAILLICVSCDKADINNIGAKADEPCVNSVDLDSEKLMMENRSLRRQVEELEKQLAVEIAQKQGIENRKEDLIKASEKQAAEILFNKQREIEKEKQKTRIRTSSLSMDELHSLLEGLSKQAVQELLGDPAKQTNMKDKGTFFFDVWEYKGKIQEKYTEKTSSKVSTEDKAKRDLRIFFDGDTVTRLESN